MFPDPAMTVAAIDRLDHHAIILEMNTASYRRKTAQARVTDITTSADSSPSN
ncbi:ATP-binding protein [Pseudomonas aeruginosa]|uniref:ATP-binding protein n=1 Tax=Pseudomonas aeruginosa TaxID=287 RepID=UPI00300419FC